MTAKLTKTDIEFLIDCLTAKQASMAQGDMLGDLMETLVKPRPEGSNDYDLRKQIEQKQKNRSKERQPIVERCILLQAKLITLRDEMDANELLDNSNSDWEK